MAKNFRCWVIVADDQPTAFRARQPEDLMPTLRQLQRTQPTVALKWFDRGRLWSSVEEADEALAARRRAPVMKNRAWRPGGTHVDPRAKYQVTRDQKRATFKRRLVQGNSRSPSATGSARQPGSRPRKAKDPE